MTLTLSILLTIAIAHERFIAIQHPIIHSQKMKSTRSRRLDLAKYLVAMIFVTIAFNLPKFFEFEVIWEKANQIDDGMQPQEQKHLRYFTRFIEPTARDQK